MANTSASAEREVLSVADGKERRLGKGWNGSGGDEFHRPPPRRSTLSEAGFRLSRRPVHRSPQAGQKFAQRHSTFVGLFFWALALLSIAMSVRFHPKRAAASSYSSLR